MWTMNFQMFKLDLKRQRNLRSNCQHPLDHWKSERVPEQHLLCFIDYAKAFDCVDHNKLWKILKVMGSDAMIFIFWMLSFKPDFSLPSDCVDHSKLWKILKELGISDQLTCLLRNLYAGQETTVRHGTTDWIQIGKGVCQAYILSPCLFNLYAEYIIWNARLDEEQAGIRIAERNINTSDI